MPLIALASVKSSPGVTTTALALASVWRTAPRRLLVEADPSGGDLGLWDFNPASRQLIVNPRWRSMLGLDPNVSVVPVRDWFTLVYPQDKSKLSALFKEMVAKVHDLGAGL